jgi:hypothetical protein
VFTTVFPGGPDTVYVYVRTYQDTEPEEPETVLLSIADGYGMYEIGTPGTATLTIIDNDSDTPAAHFEIVDDVPLDPWGRICVLAESGVASEVDVVVDDLPPGGATIHYTSTADDQIHTLLLVPAADIAPGQDHAVTELRILNPAAAKWTVSIGWVRGAFVVDYMLPDLQECFLCLIYYYMITLGELHCEGVKEHCGIDCPPPHDAAPSQRPLSPTKVWDLGAGFPTLTRYRDEVLAASPGGDYYIQLYRNHSAALGAAILERPTLIHRVLAAWDLWLPAVAAQVDGQGASFVITSEMQQALLGVMTELEEVGSASLADLCSRFRTALDLENLAGITAAALQQRIDNNSMEADGVSWGKVKSLYK